MSEQEGQLQDYSVDQLAGAVVLCLGAVGSLLLVIWQSRCHCRMNLCYIFQCERRPPTEDEMKGIKDKIKKNKDEKGLKETKSNEDEEDEEDEESPVMKERIIPEKKITIQNNESGDVENLISN